jgi:hypothetical protein
MSDINRRVFRISNGGNQDDSNITFRLNLLSSIPIMNLTDTLVSNTELVKSTISVSEPNNKPYDPNMDGRFKFIAKYKSIQRDIEIVIYYDKKYKDFIEFPNPDLIDTNTVVNKVFDINTYRIGAHNPVSKYSEGYELSIVDIDKLNIPEPDASAPPTTVTLHLLNIPGPNNSFKQRIRTNLSSDAVLYKDVNAIGFLEIKNGDLYKNKTALPVYTFINDSLIKYRPIYNNIKAPDSFYIPVMH